MPQSPDDYNFLNDYIDKIISRSSQVDDTPVEDDNDFFSTSDDEDDDQEQSDNGISYNLLSDDDFGFEQANSYLRSTGDPIDDNGEPLSDENQGAGGMTPDEEDPTGVYGSGSTGSFLDQLYDSNNKNYITSLDNEVIPKTRLSQQIASKEESRYNQINPKGGGAGAVGKYQFRWNLWKDSIKTVTGVKTREQFAHSPAAQEKYYAWYEKNVLIPQAKQLQPYNKQGLTQEQLARLVHFRGIKGAKQYLQGKLPDKPEAYNMSISKYIGTRQMGGAVVAATPSAQYHGLNNGSFSSMVFPMTGENTFRGLDDGSPVYLEDETGKKKILRGRKHKTKMTGKVYETRLNG